ncbi:hypothetical protein OS493_031279 [Desmophyllum pertusum]|uniref:N-acetyltransferase domain-containing protein n=1 Tax=Desmophyllum pertusum TaxID=174260 RepID=A0A9X0CVE8_9CNID|nr:hypothetical protein OS493_031279 [Desmophyllum pertusum]
MKGDQCRLLFYDLQGKAIPEVKLNENFVICTWKNGDEHRWMEIVSEAFGDFVSDWSPERFVDRYVATVFAWQYEIHSSIGVLHWLAVLPEYQKCGLGRALSLHVLQYHKEHGKESVSLITEVYRDAAIQLYKDIGFIVCDTNGSES